jgi:hypothetical protein
MRCAHGFASALMGVQTIPHGGDAWGWRGRTLGRPVLTAGGLAWLRVSCAPSDQVVALFWNGNIEAEARLPRSIPRPRVRAWREWNDQRWLYRGELFDHTSLRPVANAAAVAVVPDLPDRWWMALCTVLDDIVAVDTNRVAIQQGFLDWVMPRSLGEPIDTSAPAPWATAHGDFHYANLCGPTLCLLDWEGWGAAPRGYDAAMLHSYSLLVPDAAERVRRELRYILDTPDGLFAELAVISELLYAAARGINTVLVQPLRQRATRLLDRRLPTFTQIRSAVRPVQHAKMSVRADLTRSARDDHRKTCPEGPREPAFTSIDCALVPRAPGGAASRSHCLDQWRSHR